MALKLHESLAIHPGPWLRRNVLGPYGVNVSEAARHLGVTRPPLSNLLNGKAALSPEMAVRLEKAFGISAATILRMQAAYDLAQVERTADRIKVARVPPAA